MINRRYSGMLLGALALGCSTAQASELSYTFVDFGAIAVDSSVAGTKQPTATQRVDVTSADGDGLSVAGSLAVGRRFFVAGGYLSSVVDANALIVSPLATAESSGNYDLAMSRVALGYVQPIGSNFDVVLEVSYDSVEYDFGSFAGETFDVDDSGAGFGVGLRWNPREKVEVFAAARSSSVGAVDLTASQLDSGTEMSAGVRFYFFEDLGVGFDYRSSDDADTFAVSLRFGFGELRAGSN
jgi:hypothetical protein